MIEIYPPLEDSFFFADFLNRYLSKKKNKNIKYLDMGCGSGILAMAASMFFKIPFTAVDIDPFSIETTKENLRKNNLKTKVSCFQSNGYVSLKKEETFDLILCNILAKPLCEMAPQLRKHLRPKGMAILSGLLKTQSQEVIEQHQKYGLQLTNRIAIEDWETLILTHE